LKFKIPIIDIGEIQNTKLMKNAKKGAAKDADNL